MSLLIFIFFFFLDIYALRKEFVKLYDNVMCMNCVENYVSSVFVPCGHLVCCSACAPAYMECPVCNKKVEGLIQANLKWISLLLEYFIYFWLDYMHYIKILVICTNIFNIIFIHLIHEYLRMTCIIKLCSSFSLATSIFHKFVNARIKKQHEINSLWLVFWLYKFHTLNWL